MKEVVQRTDEVVGPHFFYLVTIIQLVILIMVIIDQLYIIDHYAET